MFKKILFFAFLVLYCYCQPLVAQHLNFRNYITDQVANGTVYHTMQDSKGFLWFATESGVFRFDGREYQQFTMDEGLTENEVLKIYEDSRKRIWFLTLSGRLSYFFNDKFYNHTNDRSLKDASVNSTFVSFFEDSQQNIWFAGLHSKFLKISRNGKVSKYTFDSVTQGRESFLYEDQHKQLILACRNGFFEIRNGQPVLRKLPYKPSISRCFYAFGNGNALFLAQEGLIFMQGMQQRVLIPAHKIPDTPGLSYLYLDKNQDLWITSVSDGLFHYKNLFQNPGTYIHYLPDKIITGVNQDSEKNIWFSTVGEGVYMLPAHFLKGVSYTQNQGLSSAKIHSVTVDRSGQVWLGGNRGVLNVITPQGIREYKTHYTKETHRYNRVREIHTDSAGSIWVGTDIGLAVLKKTGSSDYRIKHFYRTDSSAYSVKSFDFSPGNREIYFVQSSGIEKIGLKPRLAPHSQRVVAIPRERTFANFIDHAGRLWFANVHGLNSYDQKKLISYGNNHPLLTARITDIIETASHQLVLATYGNGLLFFKDGRMLKQLTKADGLPENTCKKLFIQGDTLWVATNKGLGKVLLSANNFFSRIDSYTVSDGLISNEVNDIFANQQNVYIATGKGLDIIPNQPLVQKASPPIIQFTAIAITGQALDLNKAADLAPGQNRLFFKYTAITFQDPANVRYQYRLLPDKQWKTTPNNSVEISAINTGSHRFEVRAKKLNSAWSQSIAFSFIIRPPFWQTWWFLTILLLSLVLLVVIVVRLIIAQKLRQQRRLLETESQLQQERERIARELHDNVGSHLAYIINSLEETPGQEHKTNTNHIRDLRDYTKQTITQLRETIWAIRQETISIRELGNKIQKLLWQASQLRPDFEFDVTCQGDEQAKLTPVQALNLYRIAQEAIQNILKHSHSTCALVSLRVLPQGLLEMQVEDKGRGFDLSASRPQDHYGLINMAQRANEMGAVFKINALPGKGTMIYLKIDLK